MTTDNQYDEMQAKGAGQVGSADRAEAIDAAAAAGNKEGLKDVGGVGGSEGLDAADDADAALSDSLYGAFESIQMTSEQEERVLAALLQAQNERKGAPLGAEDGPVHEASPQTAQTPKPAANRSRSFKAWKIALPLAACLVVGAVAVGVGALQTPTADVASQTESAQVSEEPQEQGAAATERAQEAATKGAEADSSQSYAEPGDAEALVLDEDIPVEALAAGGGAVNGGTYALDGVPVEQGSYYDDFNTEEYNALKETGFVSTKANPLSTVSADVDTASYCNVRRMINSGSTLQDLPAGAVRIEEMLNYFDYEYASPSGSDLFSMQVQSAACPWNADTQLLVLGFAAGEETQAAGKGSNLVFLVDVSGSMSSYDKLDLLQDSFATLLEGLGSNDRVSIVTYASGEEVVLEGAHGDDDKAILKAIYKLRASGSTNGEAGLKQAYEVAQRNFIEGGVNRIIMASDGDLNVGITSESDLYDYVDGQRESGIYLSVLGFGSGNYKDNKMEVLADHGNGSYHYIDCVEEAERVLKQKLTANLVPFADDVKVQVEFNPAQVKAYRLIGYENRELADEDFRDDTVDAGDVGPGAQFTVAYEVVLADSPFEVAEPELKYGAASTYDDASSDWLTCTMRYHVFDGDEMREQRMTVDSSASTAAPDANWNLSAAVIEFGMLARGSEYAGTSSEDSILDLLARGPASDEAESFKRLVLTAS